MDDSEKEELVFLRKIVNSLPGHIYWKDIEGRYLGCNQRQADALKIDRAEYIKGKTDFDLPWAEEAKELQKTDKKVIKTQKKIVIEEKVKVPGYEKERVFFSEKMPLYDEAGMVKGILGVSLDITDLKEAQAKTNEALAFAEEAERRRKQFLSNQEHDINTALAGIIYAGMVFQSLDGSEDQPDLHESAEMIVKSAERLQAYNRSLLKDLSWLDNKGKLIERRADIRSTLSKLYDINYLAAKSKGNKLIFDKIDEDIPQYLMVDDIALFQCLQDMIGNAINFTTKGTITLSVKKPKAADKDNSVIAFHVKDTGRGISPEHQRYIFEDYYKVLPSNQPDQVAGRQADEDKGRGLGLALSLKKAQAMGGELHLEWSELGVGSEFVLTIALKPTLNQGC